MPARAVISPGVVFDESSSSEEYVRVDPRARHRRNGSVVSSRHHRHHVYEDAPPPPATLAVPMAVRPRRSASTSGMPQPQIIINADNRSRRDHSHSHSRSRSRSHDRQRPRSRSRGRAYEDVDGYYIERRRPSRSPAGYHYDDDRDYEVRKQLDRLHRIEEQQAIDRAAKDAKEKYEAQRIKELLKKEEDEKQRKEDKKKAVEEWQREQDAKKAKEKKEKEEKEKYAKEGMRDLLRKQGYSEEYIEAFLKGEKKEKVELQLAVNRPKHIKVRREYLLAETLDHYKIPWYYLDKDYIVIEEYVSVTFQEELFEHTRRIKDRKLLIAPSVSKETILKVKDRHGRKDKMYIVRKKSPAVEKRIIIG